MQCFIHLGPHRKVTVSSLDALLTQLPPPSPTDFTSVIAQKSRPTLTEFAFARGGKFWGATKIRVGGQGGNHTSFTSLPPPIHLCPHVKWLVSFSRCSLPSVFPYIHLSPHVKWLVSFSRCSLPSISPPPPHSSLSSCKVGWTKYGAGLCHGAAMVAMKVNLDHPENVWLKRLWWSCDRPIKPTADFFLSTNLRKKSVRSLDSLLPQLFFSSSPYINEILVEEKNKLWIIWECLSVKVLFKLCPVHRKPATLSRVITRDLHVPYLHQPLFVWIRSSQRVAAALPDMISGILLNL